MKICWFSQFWVLDELKRYSYDKQQLSCSLNLSFIFLSTLKIIVDIKKAVKKIAIFKIHYEK